MRVGWQTGAYKFGKIGQLFSYIVGIKQTMEVQQEYKVVPI